MSYAMHAGKIAALPLLALGAASLPAPALANPEDLGAQTPASWDAGTVSFGSSELPVLVYHPDGPPAPGPVVVVMHGLERNGSYHQLLGETLASRGIIALVPDWDCSVIGGCDQGAGGQAAIDLLDWAEVQGAASGSPLEGRVDGDRRGLVGHSAGGMAVFLAAAQDPRIDSVVGFDPVDQFSGAQNVVAAIVAPTLHIAAENPGFCSSQWKDYVYPQSPAPKQLLVVAGSGHCDPEDPSDDLCPTFCSSPSDASTSYLFRRYAVAWTTCVLQADPSMQTWIGGDSFLSDEAAELFSQSAAESLDAVVCEAPPGDDDDDTTGAGDDDTAEDDDTADDDDTVGDDDDSGEDDDAAGDDDEGDDDDGTQPGATDPFGDDGGGCDCVNTEAPESAALLLLLLPLALPRWRDRA
jgi:dienelactone hydrolase